MRNRLMLPVLFGALLLSPTLATADTHAPWAGVFEMMCGEESLTFITPNNHAVVGQELGSSRVSVATRITFDDELVWQSPAFDHLREELLTTCTSDALTFWFLVPPLR